MSHILEPIIIPYKGYSEAKPNHVPPTDCVNHEDVASTTWSAASGMCRAQGIAHQKVTSLEELAPALHTAWALHRHSVVEVITARESNVAHHRQLQASVQQAVRHAMNLLTKPAPGDHRQKLQLPLRLHLLGAATRRLWWGQTTWT